MCTSVDKFLAGCRDLLIVDSVGVLALQISGTGAAGVSELLAERQLSFILSPLAVPMTRQLLCQQERKINSWHLKLRKKSAPQPAGLFSNPHLIRNCNQPNEIVSKDTQAWACAQF
jgi:hypothetical protein